MNDKIEVIEIWQPVEAEKGEAFSYDRNVWLRRIAILVNGHPFHLERDWIMQRRLISKEEADQYYKI